MAGDDTFGKWLEQARNSYPREGGRRGITRNELARLLGVDPTYIGKLERGERAPSRDFIVAAARVFEMPEAHLSTLANKTPLQESEDIPSDLVYLVSLLRRLPKKYLPIAARFFESFQQGDAEESNEAHSRNEITSGHSKPSKTRSASKSDKGV